MSNANTFAYLALVLFVPVSIILFLKWRPALATAGVFLSAGLFLPERVDFDISGLPPFDKYTAPVFCTLLACVLFYRPRLAKVRLLRWPELLAVILVVSSIGTVLTNNDTVFNDLFQLPGLRGRDIVSMVSYDMLQFILPFMFGILFYRTINDLTDLLRILVAFALIYSPFIILEVALSPQFHTWVYGFYPHTFGQTFRFGGYRPSVFMIHGIALALFICCATLAAIGLGRTRAAVFRIPAVPLGLFLAVILLICKSAAAVLYFLAIFPVVLLFSVKAQLRVAMVLALFVLSFPILRATDVFPGKELVALARSVDLERGDSLAVRFENDDLMLDKALERPVFGWGGFDRNRITEGGGAIVKDGFWIGQLGQRGFVGFAAAFGLLLLPIFIAAGHLRNIVGKKERVLVGTLALIVAVYSINFLPNGMLSPIPYLLAGALTSLSRDIARYRTTVREAWHERIGASTQHTQPEAETRADSENRPT